MDFKKILPAFSYVFHPLFTGFYGVLFYVLFANSFVAFSKNQIIVLLIQTAILLLFVPLSLFFLLKTLGKQESFTEATLKQRQIPILIQIILFYILLQFGISHQEHRVLYLFFSGGLLCALGAYLLLIFKVKASLHLMGMSALVTFVIGLSNFYTISFLNGISFLILCTGLLASSRLYLKSHTYFELFLGLTLGVSTQLIFWRFW